MLTYASKTAAKKTASNVAEYTYEVFRSDLTQIVSGR
jgi:hypothetical protein